MSTVPRGRKALFIEQDRARKMRFSRYTDIGEWSRSEDGRRDWTVKMSIIGEVSPNEFKAYTCQRTFDDLCREGHACADYVRSRTARTFSAQYKRARGNLIVIQDTMKALLERMSAGSLSADDLEQQREIVRRASQVIDKHYDYSHNYEKRLHAFVDQKLDDLDDLDQLDVIEEELPTPVSAGTYDSLREAFDAYNHDRHQFGTKYEGVGQWSQDGDDLKVTIHRLHQVNEGRTKKTILGGSNTVRFKNLDLIGKDPDSTQIIAEGDETYSFDSFYEYAKKLHRRLWGYPSKFRSMDPTIRGDYIVIQDTLGELKNRIDSGDIVIEDAGQKEKVVSKIDEILDLPHDNTQQYRKRKHEERWAFGDEEFSF